MARRTLSAIIIALGFASGTALADSSSDPAAAVPSAKQMQSEFNQLSPAAREEVMKKLGSTDPETASKMTTEQAKEAFRSLSPELQAKIREKAASLSDDQRAALKKMGKEGIKQMIMEKVKELMNPLNAIKATMHRWKDKLTGKSDALDSP